VTPLYLLAAHLLGDFVFQTRWQAAGKFGRSREARNLRLRHVATYCLPFLAVVGYVAPTWWRALLFLLLLYGLHYLTDRQRIPVTLGDVVAWRTFDRSRRELEWMRQDDSRSARFDVDRLPKNPWPSVGLAIDQTLHVATLALLGGLFL
jgi:hypothetical protein